MTRSLVAKPRWPRYVASTDAPLGDADYAPDQSPRCIARTRLGRRCAMTARSGVTTCQFHGAAMHYAELQRSGRYADFLGDREMQAAYLDFLDDPDVCDVRAELAMQRTLLANWLLKIEGVPLGSIGIEATAAITELNKAVAGLAETCDRIQTRGRHAVNVNQLEWFVEQVIAIVSDRVKDPEVLRAVADALEGSIVPRDGNRPSPTYGRLVGPALENGADFGSSGSGAGLGDGEQDSVSVSQEQRRGGGEPSGADDERGE